MKILVCGKGGSGKSTVAALLSRELARRGGRVLLVDADESNLGLSRLLGAPETALLMDSFGGRPGLKEKMGKTALEHPVSVLNQPFTTAEIPAECLAEAGGVRLVALGKIRTLGEGCACMIGALARRFLENLRLAEGEVAILDMEAGVEHFGRGVARGCDAVLCVVDPSRESVLLAGRVEEMARAAGVPAHFVLNRVRGRAAEILSQGLDSSRIAAVIPDTPAVSEAGLTGDSLPAEVEGVANLCRLVGV